MKPLTRTTVIVNSVGLIAVLVINYLSTSLPLNGKTPGELSDAYPNYFVPAGITFSIWALIYLWLTVWGVYQVAALTSSPLAKKLEPVVIKTNPWFLLSCFLNIVWLFAWHWEQLWLSVGIMTVLLVSLVQLNIASGVGVSKTNADEKWLTHIPFGIYQGWITIALIANIAAALVGDSTFTGTAAELPLTIAMIAAGTLIAVAMLFRFNNLGHGIAVSWALLGIWIKQNGMDGSDHRIIAVTALLCMLTVIAATVLRYKKWMAY